MWSTVVCWYKNSRLLSQKQMFLVKSRNMHKLCSTILKATLEGPNIDSRVGPCGGRILDRKRKVSLTASDGHEYDAFHQTDRQTDRRALSRYFSHNKKITCQPHNEHNRTQLFLNGGRRIPPRGREAAGPTAGGLPRG